MRELDMLRLDRQYHERRRMRSRQQEQRRTKEQNYALKRVDRVMLYREAILQDYKTKMITKRAREMVRRYQQAPEEEKVVRKLNELSLTADDNTVERKEYLVNELMLVMEGAVNYYVYDYQQLRDLSSDVLGTIVERVRRDINGEGGDVANQEMFE